MSGYASLGEIVAKTVLYPAFRVTKGLAKGIIDPRIHIVENKRAPAEKVGVNFLDALPAPIKNFSVNVSKNSMYMSIFFIICMIIFCYIFTSANTNTNGNNNPTKFINYCVSAWIAVLCGILITQMALSIIGTFLSPVRQ
jgi:hypothetical protein